MKYYTALSDEQKYLQERMVRINKHLLELDNSSPDYLEKKEELEKRMKYVSKLSNILHTQ
ncbi:MAG: hypothetical protein PHW96_00440 [Candidatus Nanoarchaeia archaeon]|nr:hypothetical protein [Candidatus Nanoarchaeia archaeon]